MSRKDAHDFADVTVLDPQSNMGKHSLQIISVFHIDKETGTEENRLLEAASFIKKLYENKYQ